MAVTFVLPEDGQDALRDLFVGSILECQANYKILNVQCVFYYCNRASKWSTMIKLTFQKYRKRLCNHVVCD